MHYQVGQRKENNCCHPSFFCCYHTLQKARSIMISEINPMKSIRSGWRMKVLAWLIKGKQAPLSLRIKQGNPQYFLIWKLLYLLWKKLKLATWTFCSFWKQSKQVFSEMNLCFTFQDFFLCVIPMHGCLVQLQHVHPQGFFYCRIMISGPKIKFSYSPNCNPDHYKITWLCNRLLE